MKKFSIGDIVFVSEYQYKDSIVKCDDLIELDENLIKFKIGEVTLEDLMRFITTYEKYLAEIY